MVPQIYLESLLQDRHRRRKQGGEGGGHPRRFFSLTEILKAGLE